VNTIEIAHLVNFLISEKSRQINGQIITIDGGYSAIEPSHLLH
jgi:enoyl-[acyl-carrier-protein] reductase (NADH)